MFYFLHHLFSFFFFSSGSDAPFTDFLIMVKSNLSRRSYQIAEISKVDRLTNKTCPRCLVLDFSAIMALKWWTTLTGILNYKNHTNFQKGIKRQHVFGNFGSPGDDWILISTPPSKFLPPLGQVDEYFWSALLTVTSVNKGLIAVTIMQFKKKKKIL